MGAPHNGGIHLTQNPGFMPITLGKWVDANPLTSRPRFQLDRDVLESTSPGLLPYTGLRARVSRLVASRHSTNCASPDHRSGRPKKRSVTLKQVFWGFAPGWKERPFWLAVSWGWASPLLTAFGARASALGGLLPPLRASVCLYFACRSPLGGG